jgi:hypothetical protein
MTPKAKKLLDLIDQTRRPPVVVPAEKALGVSGMSVKDDPILGSFEVPSDDVDWVDAPLETLDKFREAEENLRGPLTLRQRAVEFYWRTMKRWFPGYYTKAVVRHVGGRILGHGAVTPVNETKAEIVAKAVRHTTKKIYEQEQEQEHGSLY